MQAATAAQQESSVFWAVIDTNATKGPREHEIPIKTDGFEVLRTKTYKLDAEKPTAMEPEHAMFFLKDPAFIVLDHTGNKVKPVSIKEGGTGGFRLGDDEVIAAYDELSKEALFKRCKVLAGSDHIKETRTPKDDMISFLKSRAKPPVGVSRGSEGIQELPTDELDRLVA